MGIYVNPGNRAFAEIADTDYVDKTGLISLINQTIGKKNKLTCVSRPRRFGKSWTAKMLTAYYDCSCDSHELFDSRKIAEAKEYRTFMNQYNVICFDVTSFINLAQQKDIPIKKLPNLIGDEIHKELREMDPKWDPADSVETCLIRCVEKPEGRPFVFIIDEWDALIREAKNDEETQKRYLTMLRGWFKSISFTPKVVAAAYMTGILPIKKDGSQSAISDFYEYSMLYPGRFAEYTGFSETEVRHLCEKSKLNFDEVKAWYDGYELSGTMTVYNPFSVMSAMSEGTCRSFWGMTSAAEGLTTYIRMDFDGLQETIANLIAGSETDVNTTRFQNDFRRFRTKDDILTLLIHLGYLTYDASSGTAHIPNEEVREEFINFLTEDDVGEQWETLIGRSRQLLKDTLTGNEDAVAAAMEEIRNEQYAPQYYNNEQALRAAIKYAYLAAFGKYVKIEELPSGKGIADVVFIPTPLAGLPAMIIELKWNKSAEGAIAQIRAKHYPVSLQPFAGNILLIGINYSEKTGKHTCKIEKV